MATAWPAAARGQATPYWVGATAGSAEVDAARPPAYDYDDPANWSGGVVHDAFTGTTFAADTTLYTGIRTVTSDRPGFNNRGWDFDYAGPANLTIASDSTRFSRPITTSGDVRFAPVAAGRTLALGTAGRLLDVRFNVDEIRLFDVTPGNTVLFPGSIETNNVVGVAGGGTLTLSGQSGFVGVGAARSPELNGTGAVGAYGFTLRGVGSTLRLGAGAVVNNGAIASSPIGTGGLYALAGVDATIEVPAAGAALPNSVFLQGGTGAAAGRLTYRGGPLTIDNADLGTPGRFQSSGYNVRVENQVTVRSAVAGDLLVTGPGRLTIATGSTFQTGGSLSTADGGTLVNQLGVAASVVTLTAGEGSTLAVPLVSQVALDAFTPASAGVVAESLIASRATNLDFRGNAAGLRLGAVMPFTYNGTATFPSNQYKLGGGGGRLTYASDLTGAAGTLDVDSEGTAPGVVALTGRGNSYAGGTTVGGGMTLLANNDPGGPGTRTATGTGPVSITAGTLGGTGRIAGAVTVGDGVRGVAAGGSASVADAILSPGDGGIGTLTLDSSITFAADALLSVELDTGATDRDTPTADRVVGGSFSILAGATFSADNLGSFVLPRNRTFVLLDSTGTTPIAGTFANLPDEGIVQIGSAFYRADYQGGGGNDLTLTTTNVPEPGAVSIVVAAASAGLLGRRRRRRERVTCR